VVRYSQEPSPKASLLCGGTLRQWSYFRLAAELITCVGNLSCVVAGGSTWLQHRKALRACVRTSRLRPLIGVPV
jgi:hypothetical protein